MKLLYSIVRYLFPLILITGCSSLQLEVNQAHDTQGNIGQESSEPTSNTNVNPDVNVPFHQIKDFPPHYLIPDG